MKIIIVTAMLLLWSSANGASDSTSTASGWWSRGIDAARNDKADSALACLRKAFSQGLSDDSLYYLWAEAYLYKGVLDTALALNYSVFTDTTSTLRRQVVKQRYMIYTSLGWKKEADALLDTLKGNMPWYQKIIPECNIYLSGGGYLENNMVDKDYPYPRSTDSTAILSNGNGIASLRLGWRVPFGKTHGIRFGGKVRVTGSRFAIAASSPHLSDSAETSFGGYLNYSLLSDQLSLNYTFSRKRDFLDVRSYYHQFALRYAVIGKRWFGTVEAGYNYENPVREHYYYLMTWWNWMVGKRHDISWMLFLSGMSAEALTVGELYPYLNYRDSFLFTDSTLTDTLKATFNLSEDSNYDTLIVDRVIPQSFLGINPSIRYEYQFNKRFSGGVGCNYQFMWYRQKYTWIDLLYQESEVDVGIGIRAPDGHMINSFLVLNAEDDQYYWLSDIPTILNVIVDEQPIQLRRIRRIDQMVTLNLFLKSSIEIVGDVQLDISIRGNFSNLENWAPVDIERWYSAAMLTWFFRYRPEIYR